ncbi:MAG: aromatic ring-hydroxylating dioxygenase subunit alpha [Chloroflexi bacterium]|nr:aromatic ring-hydroxylating dioxygenase subunit alpha [Chloroflexota bacterium]
MIEAQTKGSVSQLYPALARHWLIACRSSDLRHKPLGRTVLDTHLVLFRSASGHATALLDRCSHRNAPLSRGWIADGRVVCPYHGWQFDGAGTCQAVPGLCGAPQHHTRQVAAFPVVERDGFVWIWPHNASPTSAPYRFPLLDAPGYQSLTREYRFDAALPDALENFLDGTHTHYVHSGIIRTEGERKRTVAIIRRDAERVEVEYQDEGQQSGLISQIFGAGVDVAFGRFIMPALAQLEYRAGAQTRLLVNLFFTPETANRLRVFVLVTAQVPRLLRLVAPSLGGLLLGTVVKQDRAILKLQAENLARFGGPRYTSTELDVVGPHILRLLKSAQPPAIDQPLPERRVEMLM